MLEALLVVPTLAGVGAFVVRPDRLRRGLLVLTALIYMGLVIGSWVLRPAPAWGGWLALDGPGLLVLGITSVLFLAAAIYAVGYLRHESPGVREDFFEENVFFTNEPEAVFTGCLLLFLAAMTLVALSQHIGLLWVAVEATTLASAPLIYFHRHHRSLEATWKYLVICSVGIALALLGNFLLAVAAAGGTGGSIPLVLGELIRAGSQLNLPWLKAAFLFLFIGYGTKMGLAPLHTWLPDAHSEAPSVVSALLSGALLNCAFLGIVRVACAAAGLETFTHEIFLGFGVLAVAAIFIVGQAKRMLAYSSVEHMGIIAVGMGLGGVSGVLHAINHSFTKAMVLHAINHSFTKAMVAVVGDGTTGTFSVLSTIAQDSYLGAGWCAPAASPSISPRCRTAGTISKCERVIA
jgi:hydrogenase-4 component F